MLRRNVLALIGAGLMAAGAPYPASAAIGAPLEAAIEHVREAIETGTEQDAKEILPHLRSALAHAREALHEEAIEADRAANKVIHAAIRLLKKAAARARSGDAAGTAKHSAAALAELEKVK